MALWTIADLHLSTDGKKDMNIFGDRWQGYMQKLEKNWKLAVKEEDTVVIPGDISWALKLEDSLDDMKFLDALPGKKILGKGNHDFWWATLSKMNEFFVKNEIKSISFLYNDAMICEGHILAGSRGWYADETIQKTVGEVEYAKIVNREVIRLKMSLDKATALQKETGLPLLCFLHFPPVWSGVVCQDILDVLTQYGVTECYFGHIHGNYDLPKTFNYENITFHMIAGDMLDFFPYLISK